MKWCTGLSISLIDNDGGGSRPRMPSEACCLTSQRLQLPQSPGTRQLEVHSDRLCWMSSLLFLRPLKCPCQGFCFSYNQWDKIQEWLKEQCKCRLLPPLNSSVKLFTEGALQTQWIECMSIEHWMLLLVFKTSKFSKRFYRPDSIWPS